MRRAPLGRLGLGGEDLEVEFLVQRLHILTTRGDEQFVGHVHQEAQIAGGVFAEGLLERGGHQPGVAGGFEEMLQARVSKSAGGGDAVRSRVRMRLARAPAPGFPAGHRGGRRPRAPR